MTISSPTQASACTYLDNRRRTSSLIRPWSVSGAQDNRKIHPHHATDVLSKRRKDPTSEGSHDRAASSVASLISLAAEYTKSGPAYTIECQHSQLELASTKPKGERPVDGEMHIGPRPGTRRCSAEGTWPTDRLRCTVRPRASAECLP